jgi:hypothetical protein
MPEDTPAQDVARAALELIERGSIEEKLRFIAAHDAELFVAHVLDWRISYADRDPAAPWPSPTDPSVLDAFLARLADQGEQGHSAVA